MAKQRPVDIVIVGTGMGGAAFAWQLSRLAPNLKILCLERGKWLKDRDMPAASAGWQSAAFGQWATSPNARLAAGGNPWSADYAIDDSESPLKPLMWNGVGGSSVNWAAHFPRLKPSDFLTRRLDGAGVDWPYSYNDLEPFYDLNDAMTGVCGLAGDPAYPPKPQRAMPPLPIGRAGELAAQAFNALGWHWWPVDAAINTGPYGGRQACNNCGPCLQGCMRGAKSSCDLTYLPAAMANGVEVRSGCIVLRVTIKNERVTGVTYADEDGSVHEQPASHVVVAANGIGTPRLLFASGLGRDPNSVLGRHLMMHPVAYARGLFDDDLDGPAGPVGAALYSHEFYETDLSRGFVRGFQIQVTRENSPLAQALRLSPAWGPLAQRDLAEEFRHSIVLMIVTEDLPDAENRVTVLDRMEPDGLPAVKMRYALSENTKAMIDWGYERTSEVLRAAGARREIRAPLPPMTGWHLLGTARMGDDPRSSFVDACGRCHEVSGLQIADGSIMPTVGAVNPGSTIGAMALKMASELAEELA
ncbi:MAG: GMC family oxidoreductase [Rhizobiales bacterium]|nr:GMC family oxidoreductase [Hyphomicrobiales bacterium]